MQRARTLTHAAEIHSTEKKNIRIGRSIIFAHKRKFIPDASFTFMDVIRTRARYNTHLSGIFGQIIIYDRWSTMTIPSQMVAARVYGEK